LQRCRAGDLAAFNVLIEAHQDAVFGLCLRMLGSTHSAEDVTQETFLSAYRNVGRCRGDAFRPWLLQIAVNACTDELRRRRRRPQLSLDDPSANAWPLDLPDPSESPEEAAVRSELGRHIQSGLMALPLDQRAAVVLRDVQGLSYDEIAQALRLSPGTVKSRLSRGRARLRDLLLQQRELLPRQFRLTD
jgi:RNA polymerase sigma-70 factor (ECF subfamily)